MTAAAHAPSASAVGGQVGYGTPGDARVGFLVALRAGNRRAAVAGLARDACFITPDSTVIRGRPDIAAFLAQLTVLGMELECEPQGSPLIAGDTALSSDLWTVRSGPEGAERLVQRFPSRSVAIRVEGAWKLLIVAPWGWG